MPIAPKRMPFFEHLGELRERLTRVIVVLFVLTIGLYFAADWFIELVLAPVLRIMPEGTEMVTLKSLEGMGLKFQAALYFAIIVSSPYIIWQTFAFFLPALKPKERRYVLPTFAAMVFFFLAGVAFAYFVIMEPAFQFLINQTPEIASLKAQVSDWFQTAMYLMLGFGIGFQLPIVVFYLVIFRVVPYSTLRSNWRYVYVALMLVASVTTPDWSPVTMLALWVTLCALYEGSMLFARVVLSRRIAREKAELAAQGIEYEEDAEA